MARTALPFAVDVTGQGSSSETKYDLCNSLSMWHERGLFHVEIFAASFDPQSYEFTEEEVTSMKATSPFHNEHNNGSSCFRLLTDGSHKSLKPTKIPRAAWDVGSVDTKSFGMDLKKLHPSKVNEALQLFTHLTIEVCLVWKTKSHSSNH